MLSINDQLLQKVYDSSVDALGLGQASWAQDSGILVGGALKASTGRSRSGDEERAARLHDASLGKGRRRAGQEVCSEHGGVPVAHEAAADEAGRARPRGELSRVAPELRSAQRAAAGIVGLAHSCGGGRMGRGWGQEWE